MQNFLLGEYIRQRRLELGLTQEEVCDGICEPITLSRIENGKQTPSRARIMQSFNDLICRMIATMCSKQR